MIGSFEGKVALVVGASVGIGADTARLFSDLGAADVLSRRNMGRRTRRRHFSSAIVRWRGG